MFMSVDVNTNLNYIIKFENKFQSRAFIYRI